MVCPQGVDTAATHRSGGSDPVPEALEARFAAASAVSLLLVVREANRAAAGPARILAVRRASSGRASADRVESDPIGSGDGAGSGRGTEPPPTKDPVRSVVGGGSDRRPGRVGSDRTGRRT